MKNSILDRANNKNNSADMKIPNIVNLNVNASNTVAVDLTLNPDKVSKLIANENYGLTVILNPIKPNLSKIGVKVDSLMTKQLNRTLTILADGSLSATGKFNNTVTINSTGDSLNVTGDAVIGVALNVKDSITTEALTVNQLFTAQNGASVGTLIIAYPNKNYFEVSPSSLKTNISANMNDLTLNNLKSTIINTTTLNSQTFQTESLNSTGSILTTTLSVTDSMTINGNAKSDTITASIIKSGTDVNVNSVSASGTINTNIITSDSATIKTAKLEILTCNDMTTTSFTAKKINAGVINAGTKAAPVSLNVNTDEIIGIDNSMTVPNNINVLNDTNISGNLNVTGSMNINNASIVTATSNEVMADTIIVTGRIELTA